MANTLEEKRDIKLELKKDANGSDKRTRRTAARSTCGEAGRVMQQRGSPSYGRVADDPSERHIELSAPDEILADDGQKLVRRCWCEARGSCHYHVRESSETEIPQSNKGKRDRWFYMDDRLQIDVS